MKTYEFYDVNFGSFPVVVPQFITITFFDVYLSSKFVVDRDGLFGTASDTSGLRRLQNLQTPRDVQAGHK